MNFNKERNGVKIGFKRERKKFLKIGKIDGKNYFLWKICDQKIDLNMPSRIKVKAKKIIENCLENYNKDKTA